MQPFNNQAKERVREREWEWERDRTGERNKERVYVRVAFPIYLKKNILKQFFAFARFQELYTDP